MTGDEELESVRLEVPEDRAGLRVDKFLSEQLYPRFSRSYLCGLIRSGMVRVNGSTVAPKYRLRAGDAVEAEFARPADESPGPEEIPLDVLFEDRSVVVLNKRPGIVVHPGPATKASTLVNALLFRYPEMQGVGVVGRPGLVHRLDRDTSGVMVAARSNEARENLVNQFKRRSVTKEYRAIVVGEPDFESDYVDLPIGPDPRFGDRMRVNLRDGKPASSFYQVLERFGVMSHLAVSLFTGRTHQIRVHLAHIGLPIVGDGVYGRRGLVPYQRFKEVRARDGLPVPCLVRQALHAHKLAFEHPSTGEVMEFVAPLPRDFEELLEILRDHAGRSRGDRHA